MRVGVSLGNTEAAVKPASFEPFEYINHIAVFQNKCRFFKSRAADQIAFLLIDTLTIAGNGSNDSTIPILCILKRGLVVELKG